MSWQEIAMVLAALAGIWAVTQVLFVIWAMLICAAIGDADK